MSVARPAWLGSLSIIMGALGAGSCSEPADFGGLEDGDASFRAPARPDLAPSADAGRDIHADAAVDTPSPADAGPDRPVDVASLDAATLADAYREDGAPDAPAPSCTQASPTARWQPMALGPLPTYDGGLVGEAGSLDGGRLDGDRVDGGAFDAPASDVALPAVDAGASDGGSSPGWMGSVVAVQALDSSNVWALTALSGRGATLQRWNGTDWTRIAGSEAGATFARMWVASERDVWLVAELPASDHQIRSELRHWDGTSWRVAGPAVDDSRRFVALWGLAPDDVWVVVGDDIHHWNGSRWTSYSLDPVAAPPDAPPQWGYPGLFALWGSASNDVWAAGQIRYPAFPDPDGSGASGSFDVAAAAHWDGSAWTVHRPESVASARLGGWNAAWGTAKNDVWFGGRSAKQGKPLLLDHYDGRAWRAVEGLPEGGVHSLWADCAANLWVAGYDGWNASEGSPLLLHFDGTTWVRTAFPAIAAGAGYMFNTVSGTGPDDVWVGYGAGNGLSTEARMPGGIYRLRR